MQAKKSEKIGQCGCGRSPTGKCCGWHALTEDEFRVKLAEYEDEQNKLANEELIKQKGR